MVTVASTALNKPIYCMEFDEATHTYFVDGEEMPSVTQILRAAQLVDTRWFTEFGRWRGSAVHKATKFADQGDLDRRTLDPQIKPFVADWLRFQADTGFKAAEIEQPLFDPLYRYCGTPDRIGRFEGQLDDNVIVDLKCYPSGSIPKWVRYQIAGYGRAKDPRRVFHRFAVILTGDGPIVESYPMEDYVADVNKFLAATVVAKMQLEIRGKEGVCV